MESIDSLNKKDEIYFEEIGFQFRFVKINKVVFFYVYSDTNYKEASKKVVVIQNLLPPHMRPKVQTSVSGIAAESYIITDMHFYTNGQIALHYTKGHFTYLNGTFISS